MLSCNHPHRASAIDRPSEPMLLLPAMMDEDDATTRLISVLQAKLAELDSKLVAYRQNLTEEFQKYADGLLRDVPEPVSVAVSQSIAEQMSNYPNLCPNAPCAGSAPDSPAVSAELQRAAWNGPRSPPPVLYHTSGIPRESLRSPHEREKEFHGVFTPSYLPLLDSADHPVHSPPPPQPVSSSSPVQVPLPLPSPSLPPPVSPVYDSTRTEGTQTSDGLEERLARPTPLIRRTTDTSSVESSGSETKGGRRSALRRSSSSSNRASPRRVRFEVQGEEVLPTASPQASELSLPQLGTDVPPAQGQPQHQHQLSASAYDYDSEPRALSLADLVMSSDDSDFSPNARKVSSSERLRALSKMPLEDPSAWTVVNPQAGPEELSAAAREDSRNSSELITPSTPDELVGSRTPPPSHIIVHQQQPRPQQEELSRESSFGSPLESLEKPGDDDIEFSEDEFITMLPSRRSSTSPGSRSPVKSNLTPMLAALNPEPASNTREATHAEASSPERRDEVGAAGLSNGNNANNTSHLPPSPEEAHAAAVEALGKAIIEGTDRDYGEEQLFDMDEDVDNAVGYPLSRVPNKSDEGPYIGEDDSDDSDEVVAETVDLSHRLAASPVRRVVKPPSPPLPTSSGSYKGRPLDVFDVVKDPRVHEQAAELGEFSSFVGSLNGRSGVDGSDANSYRASLGHVQFSGTPRSARSSLRSLSQMVAFEDAGGKLGSSDENSDGSPGGN